MSRYMKYCAVGIALVVVLLGGGVLLADAAGKTPSRDEISNALQSGEAKPANLPNAGELGIEVEPQENLEFDFASVGSAEILFAQAKEENEYKQIAKEAEKSFFGYTHLGVADVDNNLNIRALPQEDGKLVGKLPKDAGCEILERDGDWYHIQSGKVDGYVSADFLLTDYAAYKRAAEAVKLIATVTCDTLKVRGEPNTESEVVTMVPRGEELEVAREVDGWIALELDDEEVYVSGDYVDIEEKLQSAITMTELLYGEGVSDIRVSLCQYAKEFLGNPYVWGGTSLTKGTDCSGFTMGVYKKFGISLPRNSRAQANAGTKISISEAKAGDLIFYGKGSYINHVALYLGNGQVIHASSKKTGIKISNYNYRTPVKIVRIIQD